jgi:shikimate kinase
MTAIFLIGYRCTGKSTTGRILADRAGVPFVDTDRIVEQQSGMTIARMVARYGWDHFRHQETQALVNTAALSNPVVATGGGIVLAPENRTFMKTHGRCVWLFADPETLADRIASDEKSRTSRPALTWKKDLRQETCQVLEARQALYQELSQYKIDTTSNLPEAAATRIYRRFF